MRQSLVSTFVDVPPAETALVVVVVWTALGVAGLWTLAVKESRGETGPSRQVVTDGGEGSIEMVVAYVRPDKLNDVKRGLAEASTPSITVSSVSGRGSQPPRTGQWRGEEYSLDLHSRVKVECVVADVPTERVVDAIADTAYTGEAGDGKIFVLPVTDALQIRTGDQGTEAV